MRKIILMLWGLAALVGCSKTEQPVDGNSNRAVELSGSIIDAGVTRGAGVITGTLPESALPISVFRVDETNYSGGKWDNPRLTGYIAPATGTITLSPTQFFQATGGIRFIGLYPTGGTYVKDDRTVTFATLDGATDVMLSDFAEGNETDGLTDDLLEFGHLLTKIQVYLKAEGKNAEGTDTDDDMTEEVINSWGKVTSIEVVNKKTGAKITLPAPDAAATTFSIEAAGGEANLPLTTLTGGEPPAVPLTNTATSFGYAMFLPVESEGTLTLNINFEDGRTEPVSTATAQKYEAGKGYKITVVFEAQAASEVTVEPEGLFTDWDDLTTDQDESKTVNTVTPQATTLVPDKMTNAYLVALNSTLKFRVSRAYKYADGAFTTELRVDNQTYAGEFEAAVLWSEPAGLIAGTPTVVGSGKNAVVTVKTNDDNKYGNAVLAIKKAETDDIVWSYHIWVTGYVPEDEKTTSTKSGLTFMSRNLGALANDLSTDAYGLYYQWGRKDPFPSVENPGGVDGAITLTDTSSDIGKVSYSIQHPATFIFASASPHDWHYAARQDDLWGQGADKSVYDPCPSGWRVPQFTTLDEAGSPWSGFTHENGDWSDSDGGGRDWSTATYNDGGGDVNLFDPQSFAVYPVAGLRTHTSGAFSSAGSYGYVWCSAVSGANGSYLGISSTGVTPTNGFARARGYSVRCVSE